MEDTLCYLMYSSIRRSVVVVVHVIVAVVGMFLQCIMTATGVIFIAAANGNSVCAQQRVLLADVFRYRHSRSKDDYIQHILCNLLLRITNRRTPSPSL